MIIAIYGWERVERIPFHAISLWGDSTTKGGDLYRQVMSMNRLELSKGMNIELVQYKFFTGLVEELLVEFKRAGANIFDHLKDVRRGLMNDLAQEKKLHAELQGALIEMAMIGAISAAFGASIRFFAQVELSWWIYAGVWGWQALGVVVFVICQRRLKSKIFGPFDAYFRALAKLDLYVRINRPINFITQRIGIENCLLQKRLKHVRKRLEQVLFSLKNGNYDFRLTQELIDECWFTYELAKEEFLTHAKRLKLMVVTIFFLMSYLFLFYALIASMMSS